MLSSELCLLCWWKALSSASHYEEVAQYVFKLKILFDMLLSEQVFSEKKSAVVMVM